MSKIRTALLFSALGQYSVHFITLISITILARLLTPAEIGVYAVAGSVSLLATELRSLGVVQFLIREKEINEEKIRTALGITIAVSWTLGLVIILAAQAVSQFYNEPAIRNILWIMSSTFFIGPFTSVPIALWMREMQFRSRFIQRFFGSVFNSGSTIIFVLMGYSYYGIAMGTTLGLIVELLIAIYLQPRGTVWWPAFAWMGKLVKFGLYTSSNGLFHRFSESIPDLVIGRLASMADVGMFSRGLGVTLFINQIIISAVSPVVLPHFSDVNRSGKSVSDAYLKTVRLQLAFSWPIYAVVSIAAYPMIRALFGDQWDKAVPIAAILSLWAMLTSIHTFSSEILIVKERERLIFLMGLFVLIVRFVGVLIAVPYGLVMIAWAIVFSGLVESVVKTFMIKKAAGISVSRMILNLASSFFIALACWFAAYGINQFMPFRETSPWISIFTLFVCLAFVWLLLLKVTRHDAWDVVLEIFHKVPINKFQKTKSP
jgi:O-antigen/teichoic acid export membrane protein